MQEMTNDELALFNIIKADTSLNNYDIIRLLYEKQYGLHLPKIGKDLPNIWTLERQIRRLKQTYPSILTDSKEREIKAKEETKYKEMARDENKPLKPQQDTLGLFGEKNWW